MQKFSVVQLTSPEPTPSRVRRRGVGLFALVVGAAIGLGCQGTDGPSEGGGGQGGATSVSSCAEQPQFATSVFSHKFGTGQDFGQACTPASAACFPELVLGAPKGGGQRTGSFDVVSLGDGGSITLAFDAVIVDGVGADFLVFENAFLAGGVEAYSELARVSVSEDGESWHEFECDASSGSSAGCAGVTPVFWNEESTGPLTADAAGGDAFDLSDVGLTEARFVRIVDVALDDHVFDLDAVGVIHAECGR